MKTRDTERELKKCGVIGRHVHALPTGRYMYPKVLYHTLLNVMLRMETSRVIEFKNTLPVNAGCILG